MLLLLLFGLLFVAAALPTGAPNMSTPEELERAGARIVASIGDAKRKANAEETVRQMVIEAEAFGEVYREAQKTLESQWRDRASGYEEAYVILDELNSTWAAEQQKMIDFQFALRAQMTEEEWLAHYGRPSE